MKKASLLCAIVLALCFNAEGGLIYTVTPGTPMPINAGDSIGISSSMDLTYASGLGSPISSLVLDIHFSDHASLDLSEMTGILRLGDVLTGPYIGFTPSTYTEVSSTDYLYTLNTEGSGIHFTGLDPHGNWTLYLANPDGFNNNSLVSWSLDVTAVPEPVNVALGIFAGLFVVGGLCRTERARGWIHRRWVGVNQWLDAV